jgi:hypothetical protein
MANQQNGSERQRTAWKNEKYEQGQGPVEELKNKEHVWGQPGWEWSTNQHNGKKEKDQESTFEEEQDREESLEWKKVKCEQIDYSAEDF